MTGNPAGDADMTEILGHAYDAFETIRELARCWEDRSPVLFAAFMSAAGAATDGRDAILTAASRLPRASEAAEPGMPLPGSSPADVADWIAALASWLATTLNRVSGVAEVRLDRHACRDAAAAARQIHPLMASDDDDVNAR